jgi:hypothetical protein
MSIEDILYESYRRGIQEDIFQQVSHHQNYWDGELSYLYEKIYYELTNNE